MSRTRDIGGHPDGRFYRSWVALLDDRVRKGAMQKGAADQYASAVAHFLIRYHEKRLERITESDIFDVKEALKSVSSRRRMMSALGSFFHYLVENRHVSHDPVYPTKYGRSDPLVRQRSIFELLKDDGLEKREVDRVEWLDFLVALASTSRARRPKVRGVALRPRTCRRLEESFCRLAERNSNLGKLLRRRIAS